MEKIVEAVNAMCQNPHLLSKVVQREGEIFFLYLGKFKWSMTWSHSDDQYVLWYYPGSESIESLADMNDARNWEHVQMVTYRTAELGTTEAHAAFGELYQALKQKVHKIDEVLDEIIRTTEST